MEGVNSPVNTLHIVGAYGREATVKDWSEGKDFKIVGGPYCSIRDLNRMFAYGFRWVVILNRRRETIKVIDLAANNDTETTNHGDKVQERKVHLQGTGDEIALSRGVEGISDSGSNPEHGR
jgi:hypothetical protein